MREKFDFNDEIRWALEVVSERAANDPRDAWSESDLREIAMERHALAIVLVGLDNRLADLTDSLEKVEQALAKLITERGAGESRLAELEAAVAWLREHRSDGGDLR